jgi:hypothetical protein
MEKWTAYNLRQVERIIANSVEDKVLELVDSAEQVIAQRSHCRPGLLMAGLSMENERECFDVGDMLGEVEGCQDRVGGDRCLVKKFDRITIQV